jgi:hypothetical protein
MVPSHRRTLVLLVTPVALAGIAWGAVLQPVGQARTTHAPASVAPATVAPAPVAAVAQTPAAPAAPVTRTEAATTNAATPTVAGEAGMRIFRDPVTGEIGPPPADAGAQMESAVVPIDDAGLLQVRLPDGSYMVDLQGRFQESMVMQIDANGNRVVRCVDDPKKAFQQKPMLVAPVAPQAPVREDR